jgi:hypothetical protein
MISALELPTFVLFFAAISVLKIPAASCRESSTVRNAVFFMIRSLTPPQAAGNALAFAVQRYAIAHREK